MTIRISMTFYNFINVPWLFQVWISPCGNLVYWNTWWKRLRLTRGLLQWWLVHSSRSQGLDISLKKHDIHHFHWAWTLLLWWANEYRDMCEFEDEWHWINLTYVLRGSQNLSELPSRAQPAGQAKIHYLYIPQWAQTRQENILGLNERKTLSQ